MNVWDVGAFIGYYVALASRLTDGSVIAIEPDPNNVRRLYGTIAANGLNRIEIVPIAVGNEVGEAAFAGEGMTGLLHKDGLSNVGITTLDGLVEKFGRPDVIIMDIEGGEADALVADSRLLRENPPSFVLVELHGDAGVTAARNLVGLGYSMSTQAGTPIDVQMRKAHRVHALATMGRRDGREMPRSEVEEGL
jgi:FkbM family methyltransferase